MKTITMVVIAALLTLPSPASTQEPTAPEGARVRILQEGQPKLIGTLQALSADSIWLVDKDGRQHVRALQNTGLQRSLGRHHRFWKYFGITLGASAAAGGLVGAATWEECTDTGWFACLLEPENRGQAFVLGSIVGGVIGVPLGALLGATIKTERWGPLVTTPRDVALQGANLPRRFAISVSLPVR